MATRRDLDRPERREVRICRTADLLAFGHENTPFGRSVGLGLRMHRCPEVRLLFDWLVVASQGSASLGDVQPILPLT